MTRILVFILFVLPYVFCSHSTNAQPPKSYKKQMKQKAKEGQNADELMKTELAASKVLKKYKDKLAALGKEKQDAEASGDPVKVSKVAQETRMVKGDMFRAREKIEKKMIKDYQKINDKQTRKRMNKNKKRSSRLNAGKKPSLWQRLFH
jgi:hypothetical protein